MYRCRGRPPGGIRQAGGCRGSFADSGQSIRGRTRDTPPDPVLAGAFSRPAGGARQPAARSAGYGVPVNLRRGRIRGAIPTAPRSIVRPWAFPVAPEPTLAGPLKLGVREVLFGNGSAGGRWARWR